MVKCCQSCGLPWNKDPNGGGTNADLSLSDTYCSYCYLQGQFVQPSWTANDMQAYVIKVLAKKGVPEFMGKMLVKGIPDLARWKK
ncbi:MAG: zinc ribbon domain-containing protein [Chitinophagaceae bacterium]|nr:zinc ribbon domain-containing protein [Chitinophagaceae bacterium]